MIVIQNVSYQYNDKTILNDISFSLHKHEIIGLIGNNGAGKTTLLQVIAGQIPPTRGSVINSSEIVGYLPQTTDFGDHSILSYLQDVQTKARHTSSINKSLKEVGLDNIDPSQPAYLLSGGQKTKLGLASLLLSKPDILLLDEPTNNLDNSGLKWLSDFIQEFPGTVLIVSHDRAFLDEVTTRIIELHDGKLSIYGGNYSFYAATKEVERLAYQEKYEKNQAEIMRLQRRINVQKERAARIARSNKPQRDNDKAAAHFFAEKASRKINQNAKALESRLGQLERVESPRNRKSYAKNFGGENHAQRIILAANKLSKSYDNQLVLTDVSLTVTGSEHVWVSGPNGSGKSTLLGILAERLSASSGTVRRGNNLTIGYFSQDLSQVNLDNSGLNELLDTGALPEECYHRAKSLGITPHELGRPINTLSRGQIVKLAFAKLLLEDHDLLILDEPTNHLEIATREEIEEALMEYRGAILVASHDRYFLDRIGVDREVSLAH